MAQDQAEKVLFEVRLNAEQLKQESDVVRKKQAALTTGGHRRCWVPAVEQASINLTLHVLAPVLYLLYSAHVAPLNWRLWLLAFVMRLAFFDPILDFSKGDPLFAVGSSALTDKGLSWIAGEQATPRVISAVLRGFAFGVAVFLLGACRTLQIPDRDGAQEASEVSTDKQDSAFKVANYANQQPATGNPHPLSPQGGGQENCCGQSHSR